MRIIAGAFGSRSLQAPKGTDTRPTLDGTRESVFNVLGARVAGARVLDLFAGSGALGLEALSRGAVRAAFCDISPAACRAVRANVSALQVEDRCRVLCMPWQRALARLRDAGQAFDLAFLDPPYALDLTPVLEGLVAERVLAPGATVLLERDRRREPRVPAPLMLRQTRAYGDTRVDFLDVQGGEHDQGDFSGQL